ncbi:unnamed protein product [Lota lota]
MAIITITYYYYIYSIDIFYRTEQWTWEEARQRCRSSDATYHSDLAIMRNLAEFEEVRQLCGWYKEYIEYILQSSSCWIGLHRDEKDLNVWKWVNNETYATMSWASGEPNTEDRFVFIKSDKLYGDDCASCSNKFVCQMDNLILVKENKTWEEAIDHCRALPVDKSSWSHNNQVNFVRSDLLTLHTSEELAYAQSIVREAQTAEVWIGLRWLAGRWLWMDGKTDAGVSMPVCPANGMNCGTLSEKGKQAKNCVERRNFFCFHIV